MRRSNGGPLSPSPEAHRPRCATFVRQRIEPKARAQGFPSIYCLGIWPKIAFLMTDQSALVNMLGEDAIDDIDSGAFKDDIMKNGQEPRAVKHHSDVWFWRRFFRDAFIP